MDDFMKEVPLQTIKMPHGMLLCTGTKLMVPGEGGLHTRVVEILLPPMQRNPVATFSIVAKQGGGTMFSIYSQTFNLLNNDTEMQIGVAAQNVVLAQTVDFDFLCSYMVVGKPLHQ